MQITLAEIISPFGDLTNNKEATKMKKFNNNFKIGTKVMCDCCKEWHVIKEIHETRNWIKVEKGHGGSLQRNHVLKFTNK